MGTGRKLVDVGDVYNPKGLETLHAYPNLTSALEILEDAWLYPQSGDDLCVRMRRTIDLLLQHHPDSRMVIIGSDCITHSRESLIDAGHALSKVDVVIHLLSAARAMFLADLNDAKRQDRVNQRRNSLLSREH